MTKEETWQRLLYMGAVNGDMPSKHWDLRGADLSGAQLRDADLYEADLSGADMQGAFLNGAYLRKANMQGARLMGSNLKEANLSGANISDANLSEANLYRSYLFKADLSGSVLVKADLSEATLTKADLSGADLEGACLGEADLNEAIITEAMLNEAHVSKADLSRSDLSRADLSGAYLYKADLSYSKLTGANLRDADIRESTLIKTDLTDAVLNGICMDNANISGWNIRDVICTHIIQDIEQKKVIKFADKEFEKKYTQIESIAEIILSIPLNESASFIGKFISHSINNLKNESVIDLKGIEALSDSDTKLTFNIFDNDFYKNQKELIETTLKDALNDYFHENPVAAVQDESSDPVKEASNGIFSIQNDISIPYLPVKFHPKELLAKGNEYFVKLGETGEAIYNIVASIFK